MTGFLLNRKLAGYTIFITGASRGIGKAIGLKAAKDGANIVIAAKTAQAHPKLPGTIYTAAKESWLFIIYIFVVCFILVLSFIILIKNSTYSSVLASLTEYLVESFNSFCLK